MDTPVPDQLERPEPVIIQGRGSAAKRVLDVVLAVVGLVLSAPVSVPICAAIAIDGRPIIYMQWRWGAGGVPFRLLKFRTMVVDGEDGEGAVSIMPAVEDDPRVTRLGRFLRATGLDELPQLINILRGDMSFVGPRPFAVDEDMPPTTLDPRARLAAKPGLTGPATIYLAKDSPFDEKLRYDLAYIEERTLLGDIWLILLSVWISVRGRWESRGRKL